MNEPMTAAPKDSPLMVAWEAFQRTEKFKNSVRWAQVITLVPDPDKKADDGLPIIDMTFPHMMGSLWAVFLAGFNAGVAAGPPPDSTLGD